MLVWNGETIVELPDEEAQVKIDEGSVVAVGPFDGLRVFPTKEELTQPFEYTTKDMTAKRRGRPPKVTHNDDE